MNLKSKILLIFLCALPVFHTANASLLTYTFRQDDVNPLSDRQSFIIGQLTIDTSVAPDKVDGKTAIEAGVIAFSAKVINGSGDLIDAKFTYGTDMLFNWDALSNNFIDEFAWTSTSSDEIPMTMMLIPGEKGTYGCPYRNWHAPDALYKTVSVVQTPIPTAIWLFMSALASIGVIGRRRKLDV